MQIVGEMPAAGRQIAAHHRMRHDRLVLLLRRQRAHQRQAGALFILEQAGAGKRPGIGIVRFGAEKARRQHHLPADHEAVETEMVAEQLPSPWLGFRRIAEQAKDVGPFAKHLRPADQIAEKTIEPHHVAGDVVALGAQARAHDRHDRRLDRAVDLIEPKAMMLDVQLGILPMPPQLGVDWKARGAALRRRQALQQIGSQRRSLPASAHPRPVAKTNPAGHDRRVVSPANGAAPNFAQVPNKSWARGFFIRASAWARGVGPAMALCPGAGTNG